MKRDLYIWKGTCIYEKGPVKRDLYMWKETCILDKRLVYMNRDLYIWKETCIYEKRPVYMRRDLQRLVFKTRNVPNLMCVHTHNERTKVDVHTYTYICFSQWITAPCQLPSSSYYTLFQDASDVDIYMHIFSYVLHVFLIRNRCAMKKPSQQSA